MKCLIIAAGRGTRLSMRGDSKPLIPLLGIPLIERVIRSAINAGIDDFYVVTGYNGDKLSSFLATLRKKLNINLTCITNEEWDKGNGLSVLKAKEYLNEKFVLLMADHIFDETVLKKLITKKIEDDEVILAVDYRIENNKLVDIDDVTKVYVRNNEIKNIGKHLSEYNGFDTGMFLCTPAIFTNIEKSIKRNDDSLSGAIKIMAEKGKAKALDIDNSYWIDIDNEKSLKLAEKKILSLLTKKTDGPVSRNINRHISNRITKLLVKTNITPNIISVISFLLALFSSILFCLGGYTCLAIGGILAQLSSIIDGCDGEIARLKYITTEFGGWFDAVLDRYGDGITIFGLIYYLQNSDYSMLNLLIGFLALIGTFINSYTADKYDSFLKKTLFKKRRLLRSGRDVRMFIIFLGGVTAQPFLTLLILAVLMNLENIRRVVLLYKNV